MRRDAIIITLGAALTLAPPALAQTSTTTITNTVIIDTAAIYTTTLPSGGHGAVVMTATAGEVGIMAGLAILAAIMTFDVLRELFRRAKATK